MEKTRKIIQIVLICIAVICLLAACVAVLFERKQTLEAAKLHQELQSQIASSEPAASESSPESSSEEPESVPEAESTEASEPEEIIEEIRVENPYEEIFRSNSDMVAWITIPDTRIDYPVMWTPEDEEYYLYRDFNGRDNKDGCLLLDTDSCVDPLTTNLIIHGHNMKSGAMFGKLTDYEQESYYNQHKTITLYTEEKQRNYEIIAVFRSQVYKKSDQVFKFYKFFQANTEEEFEDFYENIKQLSIYDTGVTAEFGDHFLTLSTCVYHVKNGRFVVVAKEVEGGDLYLPVRD